jgi:site-specific recombinase XerD
MKGCEPFTDAELEQVIEVLQTKKFAVRDVLMVLLGCYTGFRISELLSLQVRDVWMHNQVPARISIAPRHMKGKRASRSVKIHEKVREAIIAYIFEHNPQDPEQFLFRSAKGSDPISRIQAYRIIKDTAAKLKMTKATGTHSMRKTFANRIFVASGHNLLKTKAALGHTDIKTTERYLSFQEADIDDLVMGQ